ncbi:MAG: response regulator [Alphaproteobacteria bacterium]|nr:response regulator [Alphaproteobacteria bacterium]
MDRRSMALWLVTLVLIALAIAVEISGIGRLVSPWFAGTAAIVALGLAGLAAGASRKALTVLETRVEILSRVLHASPDAHLIVAPGGRIHFANRAFCEAFPGSVEPPLDRVRRALAPDPHTEAQFHRLRGRVAAGAPASATLALSGVPTRAAGLFKFRISPIDDHPEYSYWRVRNVSAATQSENALRDERDMLASLLDNAPVGFYSVDEAGCFRYVNRTLTQWLGSTRAEMRASGVRLADFLGCPRSGGIPLWSPFSARIGGAHRGEVILRTRQGRAVPAWIGQNIIEAGSGLRTASVVCDLTPEREWKATLRSLERFRQCFVNAPLGIALLDRNGLFEEANRVVGELFGIAPSSLAGRRLIDFLNAEDRRRVTAKLPTTGDWPEYFEPIEIRLQRPGDKTLVLYFGRLDGRSIGAGNLQASAETEVADGLAAHFIDVTEQKNLEIQFAQSQKMQAVGQLAGGVAHDFNNLLTAMIGFCDLLLLRSPPSDPSFADIMQIKQNANRAANLVRQLLAFSRQQTLQPRVLNITDVLYDLRHLIERLIGEDIDLEVVHGRDLGPVKVDQGQLEQVIINLAVNARDAMPHGGTLTIRTASIHQESNVVRGHEVMPAGDYVQIEITDTGVGIPKENLARIFDPFFSTKEVGSGTGLGLSTVYGIVRQTGGFVFVSSTTGQGAVFQIYLPCCDGADSAPVARSETGENAAVKDLSGRGTVLLVEDDDPVRIFGARALRNKGYKVIDAKSGEAALEFMSNGAEPIDLLITDVVMPHMDGPELVREVRELHPDMKVIFISGYTEDAFRRRLHSDARIEFLAKPFSLKELAGKVQDVLAAR